MEREKEGWIQEVCDQWVENLPGEAGLGAESLNPDWSPGPEDERTMLTQSRLAYTFIHSGLLRGETLQAGKAGSCLKAGRRISSRVRELFWKAPSRGWICAVDEEGRPVDETIDSYDQSFGLLMLAWDFIASGEASLRENAREALQGLDEDCAGEGGGYRERREGDGGSRLVRYPHLRRQNPHMHLLEAFLAWHGADPEGPWLERARDMVELFRRRFRPRGNLAEYFDQSWNLAPGEEGRIREPGHHYEWVWLLRRYAEASGDSQARGDAEALYRFAQEKGTHRDGLALAAVDDAGEVLDGRKLLWPQTEMLKAQLAMYEWTGNPVDRAGAEKTLRLIRERYMRPPGGRTQGGLFYNLLEASGEPAADPTLSRLLYHLFVAAAEAQRVLG